MLSLRTPELRRLISYEIHSVQRVVELALEQDELLSIRNGIHG